MERLSLAIAEFIIEMNRKQEFVIKMWKYESTEVTFKDIKSLLRIALTGTTWHKEVSGKLTQFICNTKRTILEKDVKRKLLEFGIVERTYGNYDCLVDDMMEK